LDLWLRSQALLNYFGRRLDLWSRHRPLRSAGSKLRNLGPPIPAICRLNLSSFLFCYGPELLPPIRETTAAAPRTSKKAASQSPINNVSGLQARGGWAGNYWIYESRQPPISRVVWGCKSAGSGLAASAGFKAGSLMRLGEKPLDLAAGHPIAGSLFASRVRLNAACVCSFGAKLCSGQRGRRRSGNL